MRTARWLRTLNMLASGQAPTPRRRRGWTPYPRTCSSRWTRRSPPWCPTSPAAATPRMTPEPGCWRWRGRPLGAGPPVEPAARRGVGGGRRRCSAVPPRSDDRGGPVHAGHPVDRRAVQRRLGAAVMDSRQQRTVGGACRDAARAVTGVSSGPLRHRDLQRLAATLRNTVGDGARDDDWRAQLSALAPARQLVGDAARLWERHRTDRWASTPAEPDPAVQEPLRVLAELLADHDDASLAPRTLRHPEEPPALRANPIRCDTAAGLRAVVPTTPPRPRHNSGRLARRRY